MNCVKVFIVGLLSSGCSIARLSVSQISLPENEDELLSNFPIWEEVVRRAIMRIHYDQASSGKEV